MQVLDIIWKVWTAWWSGYMAAYWVLKGISWIAMKKYPGAKEAYEVRKWFP